jgi:hypothetical protein
MTEAAYRSSLMKQLQADARINVHSRVAEPSRSWIQLVSIISAHVAFVSLALFGSLCFLLFLIFLASADLPSFVGHSHFISSLTQLAHAAGGGSDI